jgi:DHA1 family tetracycline resistance protein-like MFS transporter
MRRFIKPSLVFLGYNSVIPSAARDLHPSHIREIPRYARDDNKRIFMPKQKSSALTNAIPLFLVLFIDGMGLGLLFPILNSIVIDPHASFLPISYSTDLRNFIYSLIVGIFMLSWFFGAAMLGDLSDQVGRKKSLLICLVGACFGYVISAIAVIIHSIVLLIIGRMVAGFTAGSQPIAQAAIVDMSPEQHKARNIALILLAVCLGFIFGPMLGGILSDTNLVSWFNFATPLYFASFISLLNALLLLIFFHETFFHTGKIKIKWYHAIEIFTSAFKNKNIRFLSLILFVMIVGWSNYFTFSSMYLLIKYQFSPLDISLFMAVLGFGFSIGTGLLVDYLTKRYSLKKIVVFGLLIASLFVLISIIANKAIYVVLCAMPIGAAIAVAYSTMISIFSNQVGPDEQGWIMGVTGSIMALCFGITSLVSGLIADISITIPLVIAVLGLMLSSILMWLSKKNV